jgi:hypothetical protein
MADCDSPAISASSAFAMSASWRFNFFLDLLFDDGAHLLARANGLEVTESRQSSPSGSSEVAAHGHACSGRTYGPLGSNCESRGLFLPSGK